MGQTPEGRNLFQIIVKEPSSEVKRFLVENPIPDWRTSLVYVLDNWPQATAGRINYLVEGGVAIKLLFPERSEPQDLDIVTQNPAIDTNFQGSKRFDVKTLQDWFAFRLPPYNRRAFETEPGRFLMDMHQAVYFEGRELLILNKLGLAVSKSLRWAGGEKREKDIQDLRFLNQDPQNIQGVIDRMKQAYPSEYLASLL